MIAVAGAVAAVAAIAAVVYLLRERLGGAGVGLAALRTVGLGALILLFVNPARTTRVAGGPPIVLLDASVSMTAAGGHWRTALDTARALAGNDGTILRFAADAVPFDTLPLDHGVTRLGRALTAARARGGPIIVVTDGEVTDAGRLPPTLLVGTRVVLVPRDTVPDAALLDVHIPPHVQRDDSVQITVTVGMWGGLESSLGTLEVTVDGRHILSREVALPPSPGTAQRRVTLRPRVLGVGDHVLRFRIVVAGDAEPRNDQRIRVVSVSHRPAIVVVVDPPEWEGRFLVRELSDIAQGAVRGYARIDVDTWVEMRVLRAMTGATVKAVTGQAELLVIRGESEAGFAEGRRGPVWRWPAGTATDTEFLAGDWYVTAEPPPSPLAGRVAAIEWDSVPPLTGVVPVAPGADEWVVMTARRGRRGAARPALVGSDSGGVRRLTTTGAGLWRWAFRGGAAREAYRTILATGVDWLLASDTPRRRERLASSVVVERGFPVVFHWTDEVVPESTVVTITGEGASRTATLRFDADGIAQVALEPGVYRWSAPAARARGLAVVEHYSHEFHPGAVATLAPRSDGAFVVLERHVRERWWLFVVAVAAFAAEWAWRHRRGLP